MRRPGSRICSRRRSEAARTRGRDRVARERADLAEDLARPRAAALPPGAISAGSAERITVPVPWPRPIMPAAPGRAPAALGGRDVRAAPHARRRATPRRAGVRAAPRRALDDVVGRVAVVALAQDHVAAPVACTKWMYFRTFSSTFSRAFSGMPAKSGSPWRASSSAGTRAAAAPRSAGAAPRGRRVVLTARLQRLEREGQRLVLQAQQLAVGPGELERARRRGRARAPALRRGAAAPRSGTPARAAPRSRPRGGREPRRRPARGGARLGRGERARDRHVLGERERNRRRRRARAAAGAVPSAPSGGARVRNVVLGQGPDRLVPVPRRGAAAGRSRAPGPACAWRRARPLAAAARRRRAPRARPAPGRASPRRSPARNRSRGSSARASAARRRRRRSRRWDGPRPRGAGPRRRGTRRRPWRSRPACRAGPASRPRPPSRRSPSAGAARSSRSPGRGSSRRTRPRSRRPRNTVAWHFTHEPLRSYGSARPMRLREACRLRPVELLQRRRSAPCP